MQNVQHQTQKQMSEAKIQLLDEKHSQPVEEFILKNNQYSYILLLQQNATPIQKSAEALSQMQWIKQRTSLTNPVQMVANEIPLKLKLFGHSSWAGMRTGKYFFLTLDLDRPSTIVTLIYP